ncbi:MAG: FAD-dependent oxidoreductase [Candidatus Omnitrophota bacterium]|nr:MAG: FAD-dependent oxidoreductase [Candidatus Omnitrophota bacterium]
MRPIRDLAIIGGGIGGVSSAIYAKRAGLDFLFFESNAVGGQLLFMENVDNYVGLEIGIRGQDFAKKLEKNLKDLRIDVCQEEIVKVEEKTAKVEVHSGSSSYEAKGLIVATGASPLKLAIPGEDGFVGKGVSYCAICDGFFFKDKEVVVVGGGNTAVEEALYLAQLARKVTLIHRKNHLRALQYLQAKLFQKDNIEVIFESVVKELKGKEFLEGLILENTQTHQRHTLPTSGLFIAVGVKPNTEIVKNIVSTDEKGFIITDNEMRTSSNCIWACGDCRLRPLRQLITAASEGALATLSAYKYLKGHYIST